MSDPTVTCSCSPNTKCKQMEITQQATVRNTSSCPLGALVKGVSGTAARAGSLRRAGPRQRSGDVVAHAGGPHPSDGKGPLGILDAGEIHGLAPKPMFRLKHACLDGENELFGRKNAFSDKKNCLNILSA